MAFQAPLCRIQVFFQILWWWWWIYLNRCSHLSNLENLRNNSEMNELLFALARRRRAGIIGAGDRISLAALQVSLSRNFLGSSILVRSRITLTTTYILLDLRFCRHLQCNFRRLKLDLGSDILNKGFAIVVSTIKLKPRNHVINESEEVFSTKIWGTHFMQTCMQM